MRIPFLRLQLYTPSSTPKSPKIPVKRRFLAAFSLFSRNLMKFCDPNSALERKKVANTFLRSPYGRPPGLTSSCWSKGPRATTLSRGARLAGGYLIHRWFFVGRLLEKRVCHPLVRSGTKNGRKMTSTRGDRGRPIFGVPGSIFGVRGSNFGSRVEKSRNLGCSKKSVFLRGRGVPRTLSFSKIWSLSPMGGRPGPFFGSGSSIWGSAVLGVLRGVPGWIFESGSRSGVRPSNRSPAGKKLESDRLVSWREREKEVQLVGWRV